MRILAGALGDCVHVAGVSRFLSIAEQQGHETLFTGPATDIESFVDAIHNFDPDVIGVSYRLTPENARLLLQEFWGVIRAAGLSDRRFVFGGTPPVAAVARELGGFEAIFDGSEAPDALIRFLRGEPAQHDQNIIPPQSTIARIQWKAPYPLLRHHFGIPAFTIEPTVEGIAHIAEAGALDVISLGADQDAQEHFFRPDLQNPKSKGAGGVPFRSEKDLLRLREAAQRGNYPLLRSYSGTADLLRYADMLVRTLDNAWCATSLFFFNAMDGRGPLSLEDSIRDHLALMAWHGARDIPVEGNEPYHWGMRDAPDVISVAASYLYAYNAKKAGVRDYITTYMFESPNTLSNRMDLAKALAQIRVAEAFADADFRIWRQTRTGLLSYPVDMARARAHLAESIYLQMALRPAIVHIVGYTEADHAATAAEVIESSVMAQQVIGTALYGQPDMTADPGIQARAGELVEEAHVLLEAIRRLGADAAEDPLSDPATLARAVQAGLLDAPQLQRNRFARGEIRSRTINGAVLAVDAEGHPLTERQRLKGLGLA
ncbi:MAG TPA: cobalamin B12-binding domain-containing protein [Anaerolineae bacterium]|nr:cobalamin B12-binding domain-containing protein [Anaerolineae bacterium]HQM15237.1 cobalamin B12-binding domain-containing protein [Anaerolineae bacterium]